MPKTVKETEVYAKLHQPWQEHMGKENFNLEYPKRETEAYHAALWLRQCQDFNREEVRTAFLDIYGWWVTNDTYAKLAHEAVNRIIGEEVFEDVAEELNTIGLKPTQEQRRKIDKYGSELGDFYYILSGSDHLEDGRVEGLRHSVIESALSLSSGALTDYAHRCEHLVNVVANILMEMGDDPEDPDPDGLFAEVHGDLAASFHYKTPARLLYEQLLESKGLLNTKSG